MTDLLFTDLGLPEPVQRSIAGRNHITATPIQSQAIPKLLKGHDMIGIAQTGTGKTAAFALPILSGLAHKPAPRKGRRAIRSLILAPTRELAIQIGNEFQAYAKNLKVFHAVILGGVSQKPQVDKLRRGIDILIATPGRLLDLMNQGHVNLSLVESVVLDEADRMLDMGFVRDVNKIITALPNRRQSMLFSATMSPDIVRLSQKILDNPIRIEVTPPATPVERVIQTVYHVPSGEKRKLLINILNDVESSKVIVFTRTKNRANRITEYLLKTGINTTAIHGNKSQGARQRALAAFKSGSVKVMVATDIAARGIDVTGITHVINYDLPNEPESYVHRIGRTGRAGAAGIAIALCDPSEQAYLRKIERLINTRLTVLRDAQSSSIIDSSKRKRSHKSRGVKSVLAKSQGKHPTKQRRHLRPHDNKEVNTKARAA